MKNIDFDYEKNLTDEYKNEEKYVIRVYLKDINEIYDEYDDKKMKLNHKIGNYIYQEVKNIPFKYDVTIELSTDEISKEEREKIKNIIKKYYAFKAKDLNEVLKINKLKAFILLILGASIISLSYFGQKLIGTIYGEFTMVIGWVLSWEGLDILMLSNSEKRVKIKNYKQLYNADIVFSDKLEIK